MMWKSTCKPCLCCGFGWRPLVSRSRFCLLAGLPLCVSLTNNAAVYAWSEVTCYCLLLLCGAMALYRDGAGFDVTGPACAISVLVGLGFIACARHLLLSASQVRHS